MNKNQMIRYFLQDFDGQSPMLAAQGAGGPPRLCINPGHICTPGGFVKRLQCLP